MRILYVEDEKYLAEAVIHLLKKEKIAVDHAADGVCPEGDLHHLCMIQRLACVHGQLDEPAAERRVIDAGTAVFGHRAATDRRISHVPEGVAQIKMAVFHRDARTFLERGFAVGRTFKAAVTDGSVTKPVKRAFFIISAVFVKHGNISLRIKSISFLL